MATGFITPVLILKKMTANEEITRAIQTAYGSFGIAWRLLDDINDIGIDMEKGTHSAVYTCLPGHIKIHWDKGGEDNKNRFSEVALDYIIQARVIDRIKKRICSELDSAASIADDYNMTGLAHEFRCLSGPLRLTQDELWTGEFKQRSTWAS